jgi:hypothetical protein
MSTFEDLGAGTPDAIDAMTSVREHPSWYFRSGMFSVPEMIALLADEAVSHGASDFAVQMFDGCWVVQSARDWLDGDDSAFFSLVPDPGRGSNSSRVEILLTVFCQAVWTGRAGDVFDLKATIAAPDELAEVLANPEFGRVIAFIPPPSLAHPTANSGAPGSRQATRLKLVHEDLTSTYERAFEGLPAKQAAILAPERPQP